MAAEAPSAFFSYCRDDSDFALRLAEDLKAAGANVWIDQLDIEPGMPWDRAVEDALNNCPRMLVILSPVSVKSDNVRDEVSFALSKQKRVIPVLYRECSVPFRLGRLQHIDFRTDYARGLKLLLKALGLDQPPQAVNAAPAEVHEDREPHISAPRSSSGGWTGVRSAPGQARAEAERKQGAEQARLEQESKQAAEQALPEEERERAEQIRLEEERRIVEHSREREEPGKVVGHAKLGVERIRGWLARHRKLAFAITGVFITAGIVGFVSEVLHDSEISKLALGNAQSNPAFVQRLGTPVKYGWFPAGEVGTTNSNGHADMAVSVTGPKAKGTLYVVATKSAGQWTVETLQLKVEGENERIDLLSTPQTFPPKSGSSTPADQASSQQTIPKENGKPSSQSDTYQPETVIVRHILIKTPTPGPDGKVDQAGVDAARRRAEDVLKQLKAGASFTQLAKKYSDDPATAQRGGLLPPITKGQTVPEFEQAAFNTPPGQTTDLVRSMYGFHIIQVESHQQAR